MDLLNWRNLIAVLIGGVLAGVLIGAFQLYREKQREEIGAKLYEIEKLLSRGEVKKAERLTEELPSPSKAYGYLAVGDLLASKGETEKAVPHFGKAAAVLSEGDEVLSYYSLEKKAHLLYRSGRYSDAERVLSQIPEDAPNGCSVKLLKAEVKLKLGKTEEAKKLLEELAGGCPDAELALAARYLLNQISN